MAACLAAAALQPVLGRPMPQQNAQPSPAAARSADGLQLKVRRLPDAVELVLEDAGLGATLTQQPFADRWQGELRTDRQRVLRVGPQSVALPADGLERISLDGSGSMFSLSVTPTPGSVLGSPVISSDGRDLVVRFPAPQQFQTQTVRPNLTRPTPVPTETYVPPLRPRAVAPPVGDMAVGTMTLRNRGFIQLQGPPVTLTTRGANPRDVLMAIAQMGNYGFVWVDDSPPAPGGQPQPVQAARSTHPLASSPVSLAFRSEPYASAFNAVLMAAGLQARRQPDSRIIFVGPSVLSKSLGNQVSKVYRLNQVGPNQAADYLANLGAQVSKTFTETVAVTEGIPATQAPSSAPTAATTATSSLTRIDAYGASSGPLLGLRATTDTRLGTITLFGEQEVISIAEQYLKTLDLRQRQVALSLKILDVDLSNDTEIDNSFAIRWGDTFIVNDRGSLIGAFGRAVPPRYEVPTAAMPLPPPFSPAAGFSNFAANPGLQYPENQFFDFLRAQIVSRNTKLLASPTLILQENPALLRESGESVEARQDGGVIQGVRDIAIDSPIGRRRANEGVVRVGTNVVTRYETETTQGAISCVPVLSTAGLVLGARVEKIDDNGFVTFTLSPSVSAVTDTQPAPSGCGAPLNILSIRNLDTGALRVRDGQTLILTGVISDFTRTEVSKWPILGDIPLIGQFFRASGTQREKRELVIMVSPRIIDDGQGGAYGYGYTPSTDEARDVLGNVSP